MMHFKPRHIVSHFFHTFSSSEHFRHMKSVYCTLFHTRLVLANRHTLFAPSASSANVGQAFMSVLGLHHLLCTPHTEQSKFSQHLLVRGVYWLRGCTNERQRARGQNQIGKGCVTGSLWACNLILFDFPTSCSRRVNLLFTQ